MICVLSITISIHPSNRRIRSMVPSSFWLDWLVCHPALLPGPCSPLTARQCMVRENGEIQLTEIPRNVSTSRPSSSVIAAFGENGALEHPSADSTWLGEGAAVLAVRSKLLALDLKREKHVNVSMCVCATASHYSHTVTVTPLCLYHAVRFNSSVPFLLLHPLALTWRRHLANINSSSSMHHLLNSTRTEISIRIFL